MDSDTGGSLSGSDRTAAWFPYSLRVLLGVIFLVAILGMIFTPMWIRSRAKSTIVKARSDMRSLAVAIETYYVDNMEYPAMTLKPEEMPDRTRYPPGVPMGRTFRNGSSPGPMSLTTPIVYIHDYPHDPFTAPNELVYRYYVDSKYWVLGSFGPDRDMKTGGQLQWNVGDITTPLRQARKGDRATADSPLEQIYSSLSIPPNPPELLAGSGINGSFTYDPTNGVSSDGDVWRTRQ